MLVSRITVENVRSFLEPAELSLAGPLSIIIGPNGGGKTNLLDTLFISLRRYLFASMYAADASTPEQPWRREFRFNDMLNHLSLEPHSLAKGQPSVVTLDLEVTHRDIENMRAMKRDAPQLLEFAASRYGNVPLSEVQTWDLASILPGQIFSYRIAEGRAQHSGDAAYAFMRYLQFFEVDALLRQEAGLGDLSLPLLYLPVNRAVGTFEAGVELANHNSAEIKRQTDAVTSRRSANVMALAVGQLAQKFRLLLENDSGTTRQDFMADPQVAELTRTLAALGYEWSLECTVPMKNQYDIRLKKQESSFLVGAASSGERELLTYLFAIFALNVRDALIIVDEPELHLHPKWQKALLDLFRNLAGKTGNRFLLATHSPTFISPESIQFVSRVFSKNQRSNVVRLDANILPDAKHLLNIVNSQNNERLFFADLVVLVEGLSDRIVFEALITKRCAEQSNVRVIEVLSVGGKGLFAAYKKVLTAARIPFVIVADQDYLEQVGTESVKELFVVDHRGIKDDVVANAKSRDADALVAAIEEAIKTGSWHGAEDVWAYIKSRRRRLSPELSGDQRALLQDFLRRQRAEHVFILSEGALEAYLPADYAGKDLERLIAFIAQPNFDALLPAPQRDELSEIVDEICAIT